MSTNTAVLHAYSGRAEARTTSGDLVYVLIVPAIACAVSVICAFASPSFAAVVETVGLY